MGDDTPDQSAGTQRMSKAREGQIRDYAEAMVLTGATYGASCFAETLAELDAVRLERDQARLECATYEHGTSAEPMVSFEVPANPKFHFDPDGIFGALQPPMSDTERAADTSDNVEKLP